VSPQQIAVIVVAVTLGLLVALLVLYGRPRRARQEPMPANFSRGDPDSVLEGPRLHQVQVWGVASTIFIAAFLVVYFVVEPFRAAAYHERFHEESVERGHHEFIDSEGAFCSSCHGPGGEGGFSVTDPAWPAPPLNNILARYSAEEVRRIIEMGRPGTPMPEWGIEFGGPLNEQKIEDLMNYIDSIQVDADDRWELPEAMTDGAEVFARKCAVCHGPDARGQAMGQPIPTFFAPDLSTVHYRLGLKVAEETIRREIRNELLAERAERTDPTDEEIAAAMAALSPSEIIEFGDEAVRETVEAGRRNTPMPAWRARILPEQVDAVMEYLHQIQRVPS
jgi:mono/diheme cytochrome c family protein